MDRNERRAMALEAILPCQQTPDCVFRFGTGSDLRGVPYAIGGLDGGMTLAHCIRLAWLFVWPVAIFYLERTPSGPRVIGRSSVLDFILLYGPRDALLFLLRAQVRTPARHADARRGELSLASRPASRSGA